MAIQIKNYITIIVLLFIAFTIGLNLGLHGVLAFDRSLRLPTVSSGENSNHAPQSPTAPLQTPKKYEKETLPIERLTDLPVPVHRADSTETRREPSISNDKAPAGAEQLSKNSLEGKMLEVRNLVSIYAAKKYKEISARLPRLSAIRNDIPILLLTCNRPALLQQTLESLLQVRGVKKENVIISQDGALPEVADIAKKSGFTLIQNLNGLRLRGGAATDGASRIAQHYKYSLSSVFDRMKDAQAVIVIEDDLLFSPDMYEYLLSVAPILDADPTAFVVSAWSDNGFKDKVHEPYALRRTDYFPGLGWLLTRKLYKEELEPRWPSSHWDHWLRSEETSKHRDIIYPQVSIVICTIYN